MQSSNGLLAGLGCVFARLSANSGDSNSLTYGSYKSESYRSTSIGCGEFTNHIKRELCGACMLLDRRLMLALCSLFLSMKTTTPKR